MTEQELNKLAWARHKLSHIVWHDKYYDKLSAQIDVQDALKVIKEILEEPHDRTR